MIYQPKRLKKRSLNIMALALVKMGIYNTYTDMQMIAEGGSILDTIERNTPITELVAQVLATRDSYKDFVEAYNEAASRSTQAIASKKAKKLKLADNFVKLAIGVNYFANGNEEILAETGMPRDKSRGGKVKVVLQKPEGLTAVNCGNSGCVKVAVKVAIGANSFVYQWTMEPVTDNSVWESDGSGLKSFIWEGLNPGTIVWFRVIAIGSGNKRLTSDAVSCMVI
jgi:hypothetical protein